MRFVDLHCDTISRLAGATDGSSLRSNRYHIDIERMKKSGALLQCFALYIETTPDGHGFDGNSPYEIFEKSLACYKRELAKNQDIIVPVRTYNEIEKNMKQQKISSLLTLEDAVPLDGKIERVQEFYDKGVRMVTLTWNYENSLGFPNGSPMGKGLKPFGFQVVEKMNELGMIVDVSHLSDQGFWDVSQHAKNPFIASHSNARELCPVSRNLTDEMLRTLGEKGGVVGLNFASSFLVPESKHTKIQDILKHAKYIANIAGIECLALGSDFDGIDNTLEFTDYSGMPQIEEALHTVFSASEVDKITHENALRIFRDCLG